MAVEFSGDLDQGGSDTFFDDLNAAASAGVNIDGDLEASLLSYMQKSRGNGVKLRSIDQSTSGVVRIGEVFIDEGKAITPTNVPELVHTPETVHHLELLVVPSGQPSGEPYVVPSG